MPGKCSRSVLELVALLCACYGAIFRQAVRRIVRELLFLSIKSFDVQQQEAVSVEVNG